MPSTSPAVNYWPEKACAKAFSGQQELPPYRQLLMDTLTWLDPQPGDRWLDLGCGTGALTKGLWLASNGEVADITGMDVAGHNEKAYEKLRQTLRPAPGERLRFIQANFSAGLLLWNDETFEGVVSGLAIQYAESYCAEEDRWTTSAYDHVLAEVCRVLKPGGRFVFSVNVPEPLWSKVAFGSVIGFFTSRKPLRYLQKAWRMLSYGVWLKREARRGRFHYLPASAIVQKLAAAGFRDIEYRLTFTGQAYVFRCRKP